MPTHPKFRSKYGPDKLAELSVEQFRELYFTNELTIKQIAEMLSVSRVGLYKWFARYGSHFAEGLQRRSGNKAGYTFNKKFFDIWTPEMAYVLGVLATDGCVGATGFSLTSTDLELVEKIRSLLKSNHPIRAIAPKGWGRKTQYKFAVSSTRLAKQLTDLGVGPAKSLTLDFPEIPQDCIRHFLRGCWDGDGSFYFESPRGKRVGDGMAKDNVSTFRASFVSGSKRFVEGIIAKLNDAGIGPRKHPKPLAFRPRVGVRRVKFVDTIRIYETRRGESISYSLRLVSLNAISFGRLLYEGVPQSMYLVRKYDVFWKAAQAGISIEDVVGVEKQDSQF